MAGRIAAQRHLKSLRDGTFLGMPLIIIGSVFLVLGNLPIGGIRYCGKHQRKS